jgi:ribosomal-protein-alanine N-acetyltransferase
MEPEDIPTVMAIDRLSFPTPWPASSYSYELHHSKRSFYYTLLRPGPAAVVPARTPSRRRWRRWLRSAASVSQQVRIIGYVGFRLRNEEAHISTLAVHPDWRGKGLGELLLLVAIEKALELGARLVTLEVRASNRIAQRLYHKYDLRFKSVHPGYYRDGEDAWLMEVTVDHDAYRARLAELRRALEERLCSHEVEVGQNIGDTL